MKTTRVMLAAAGGWLMAAHGGLAGEMQIRGLSLVPGYPKQDVFLHEAKGGSAGVKIEVKSFLNHDSDTVTVAGPSLVLTSEESAASIGEPDKVLGKIDLPPRCASGIVLLAPAPKDGAAEARLVPDAFTAFPPGSIKVVNLAPDPVRIELEGKGFECAAGGELLIQDPPVGERYASGMRAFRKQGDDWVQVMAGIWPHPGKKRVLQIITINPAIQRIEIKGVRDISSPPRR